MTRWGGDAEFILRAVALAPPHTGAPSWRVAMVSHADDSGSTRSDPASTASLLHRIRGGDASAREQLVARHLPALRRWARGRLPSRARGHVDTDDLVQVTLLRALDKVKDFEARRPGAFFSYLRTILMNEVRDQIRRAERKPAGEPVAEELRCPAPSPVEIAVGRQGLERYEAALARLTDEQREAVVMSVEMGFTHAELADALGKPTPNAARMVVARAMARLAEHMDEED